MQLENNLFLRIVLKRKEWTYIKIVVAKKNYELYITMWISREKTCIVLKISDAKFWTQESLMTAAVQMNNYCDECKDRQLW